MKDLNPGNALFENLATNPPDWWQTLVKVLEINKRLNILSDGLKGLSTIGDFTIHTKPLLVIGRCEQVWIDKNKDLINDKVRPIAYGTYYRTSFY